MSPAGSCVPRGVPCATGQPPVFPSSVSAMSFSKVVGLDRGDIETVAQETAQVKSIYLKDLIGESY
jgi:hypothetical protein